MGCVCDLRHLLNLIFDMLFTLNLLVYFMCNYLLDVKFCTKICSTYLKCMLLATVILINKVFYHNFLHSDLFHILLWFYMRLKTSFFCERIWQNELTYFYFYYSITLIMDKLCSLKIFSVEFSFDLLLSSKKWFLEIDLCVHVWMCLKSLLTIMSRK